MKSVALQGGFDGFGLQTFQDVQGKRELLREVILATEDEVFYFFVLPQLVPHAIAMFLKKLGN